MAPASTVYCQAAVSRCWCGWIEKCAACFASAPWLAIENQARILPAAPNSKRSRLPFTWYGRARAGRVPGSCAGSALSCGTGLGSGPQVAWPITLAVDGRPAGTP